MHIDKKNYRLKIPAIDKILNKFILKNRIKIFNIFENNVPYNQNTKIIDVGTTPILEEHENIIFQLYKWKENITGFSNQNCNILKNIFAPSNFIIGDARNTKLENDSYDISFCSATIEHVGNYNEQKQLINELFRISKEHIFITTPNRNFPLDFHTKLPLLHLLPKKIHRSLLRLLRFEFLSKEENLNLLNINEIKKILNELNIVNYSIYYNKFLFMRSNIIVIINKK